jgi:hypothetical protein
VPSEAGLADGCSNHRAAQQGVEPDEVRDGVRRGPRRLTPCYPDLEVCLRSEVLGGQRVRNGHAEGKPLEDLLARPHITPRGSGSNRVRILGGVHCCDRAALRWDHQWGIPAIMDAAALCLAGVAIRTRWRPFAVVGLAVITMNVLSNLLRGRVPGVLVIFLFVGFVSAVRGTFAYHRLTNASVDGGSQTRV